jgi:hypothetical protein
LPSSLLSLGQRLAGTLALPSAQAFQLPHPFERNSKVLRVQRGHAPPSPLPIPPPEPSLTALPPTPTFTHYIIFGYGARASVHHSHPQ